MTTLTYAGGPTAAPSSFGDGLRRAAMRAIRLLRRAYGTHVAARRLAALDDRLLADIGLERHEIADAVNGRGRFAADGRRG